MIDAIRRATRLLAVLAILPAAVARGQGEPGDWPMYNHDVSGWRYNPAETTIGPSNAGRLVEQWRFPARGSGMSIGVIHATPTIVGGYAYFGTATDPAFYKVSPEGKLCWVYRKPTRAGRAARVESASEAASEPLRDKSKAPEPEKGLPHDFRFQTTSEGIMTSALVTEDSVYFGDMAGWFYALDRETGRERWRIDARGKDFPGAHAINLFFASPILADGKIITGGGALEQLIAGGFLYRGSTGRGFLLALEPKTGQIAWKYDLGPRPEPLNPPIMIRDSFGIHFFYHGPATSTIWSTPSFDAGTGTLYFGTDVNTAPRRPTADDPRMHTRESCAVVALDVHTGKERWVQQIKPGDVWTNAMRAYDPKEGRHKDQSIGDTPKLYDLDVEGKPTKVVGVGCKDGGFYVLRASDGTVLDHTPIYTGPPTYPLSPTPDRRMLALPSCIGGLQTGCATDGRTIFTNGIDAIRLMSQETMAASGPPTAGRVVAISLDTTTERWRHERPRIASLGGPPPKRVFTDVGDPVASGLAVANGVVYFTTVASGKLVALDAATGKVLKEIALGPVWSGPSVSRGRVYVGTGNTLFTPSDQEAFLPKRLTGELYCFGL